MGGGGSVPLLSSHPRGDGECSPDMQVLEPSARDECVEEGSNDRLWGDPSPVLATSIYLTVLVIMNAVFISSMLIVPPSNIWCALALMEGDIWARRRPNIWVTDPIFDLIKIYSALSTR